MTAAWAEEAHARFEAGNFAASREAALSALGDHPDDPELLRLAGMAAMELELDDAVDYLRKAAELEPDNASGWRDLGNAMATEGRTSEAADAFRRAVELDPQDESSLTALGHMEATLGRTDEAIGHLARAAMRGPGASTASISLVEMYKSVGQPEDALAAAIEIAKAQPQDVLAALDVAELSLDLGRPEEASSAYRRLRDIDDVPDHEIYSLHGLIRAEIQDGDWSEALRLAEEANRMGGFGRTGDVRAFLQARVAAAADGFMPAQAELEAALAASHAEHRRLHLEDRRLEAEDLG